MTPLGDAFVVDVGSLNTYWGYAGDEEPRQQMTSAWCYRKTAKEWSTLPADFLEFREEYQPHWANIFGNLPEPLRSYARQSQCVIKGDMDDAPPMKKCSVNPRLSKSNFGKSLQHVNKYHHDAALVDKPLLVSQPTKCLPAHTRALAEVAFERVGVGAFYAMRKASLAAMAMGRATACVVELGPFSTSITPVFEGYHLEKNMQQYAVGGVLQEWMLATSTRLWDAKANAFDPMFHPYSELRKNRQNFGTFPVESDEPEMLDKLSGVDRYYLHYSQRRIVQDLKENVLRVNEYKPAPGSAATRTEHEADDLQYELPDGKVIYVPEQVGRDVAEFMLTPKESVVGMQCLAPYEAQLSPLINSFPGIATAVIASAFKNHVDFRQQLLSNVVVVGGGAALEGLMERIAADLTSRPQVDVSLRQTLFGPEKPMGQNRDVQGCKFKVASQSAMERKFTTWVGGSIMAMLSTFQDVWITREDWAENGPSVLERRKLFA